MRLLVLILLVALPWLQTGCGSDGFAEPVNSSDGVSIQEALIGTWDTLSFYDFPATPTGLKLFNGDQGVVVFGADSTVYVPEGVVGFIPECWVGCAERDFTFSTINGQVLKIQPSDGGAPPPAYHMVPLNVSKTSMTIVFMDTITTLKRRGAP